MVSRMEMMKRHLENPGSRGSIGVGRNYEDVTEETVADLEAKITDIDDRLDRLRRGNV